MKVWVVIDCNDDYRVAAICATEARAERWVLETVRETNAFFMEVGDPARTRHDNYDIREREVLA